MSELFSKPRAGYGFIYVLSNPSMPNVFKVGLTTNPVGQRISELNSTGVPKSFELLKKYEVAESLLRDSEIRAHKKLKKNNFHHGKEFFEGQISDILDLVEDAILEITGELPVELIKLAKLREEARKNQLIEEARLKEKEKIERERAKEQEVLRKERIREAEIQKRTELDEKIKKISYINRLEVFKIREEYIAEKRKEYNYIIEIILLIIGASLILLSAIFLPGLPIGILIISICFLYWNFSKYSITAQAAEVHPYKTEEEIEKLALSNTENFTLVSCDKCGQKLRVPANKAIESTCPKCGFSKKGVF